MNLLKALQQSSTAWGLIFSQGLTQGQLIELFDSIKASISEHIKLIFQSNELDESATVRKFRTVQMERKRNIERARLHYNLDGIRILSRAIEEGSDKESFSWLRNIGIVRTALGSLI